MADLTLSADLDAFLAAADNAAARTALGLGTLATQSATITDYLTIAAAASLNTTGNAGTVTTINGRIAAGSNITITGAGTAASPYSIAASGVGGGDALVSGTLDQFADVTQTGTLALSGTITITGGTHSGTNTGDQTTIVGITGTKAQFDTACTDGNFLYVGDVTTNATHTGDVTGSGALTIAAGAVTLAKMADLAQDQFVGRTTASTGVPETATITAAARTVLDDTTVAAMVDTLGGASAQGTGGIVRATSPTITAPTVTGYTETVVAIGNSGTTQTLAITGGTVQTCTLTGNCTFTMPTATAGKSFVLYLKSGAGGFTGTFTGVKWSGGTAPTITATASRMDILTFVADGTNWYGSALQDFTP